MAVLIETNLGDLVIDLKVDHAPRACLNFIKLCKMKYYNNCLFLSVEKDYIARTGDPTNTGRGGCCVHAKLPGLGHRYFKDCGGEWRDEIHPKLKHSVRGTVGMANEKPNENGSQFYVGDPTSGAFCLGLVWVHGAGAKEERPNHPWIQLEEIQGHAAAETQQRGLQLPLLIDLVAPRD
eukprot:g13169.t1